MRQYLCNQQDLAAWLERKAQVGGFVIIPNTLRTISKGQESFFKQGHRGLHAVFEFQGELSVIDPKQFRHTIENGIGTAKAFGFGLLVVAPTKQ